MAQGVSILIPLVLILIQIVILIWFIDTLGKIKVYLREVRDTLQRDSLNR